MASTLNGELTISQHAFVGKMVGHIVCTEGGVGSEV